MPSSEFADRLAAVADATEAALARLLDHTARPGETTRPARLIDAMRYSALGGGKRLRPFLLIEAARLVSGRDDLPDGWLRAGAAIECIHCYSLIHDDLPSMDNDDIRRGKPTLHRAFDEATAILAGDGLNTLAFDLLADPETDPDPAVRADLVLTLARAAGIGGMVGGQMLDLAAEGRFAAGRATPLSEAAIRQLQGMKTGALLRAACAMGAALARADADARAALDCYARHIGLAFQVADDLLDHEGDAATVGKAVGKDQALGKGTLVSLHGADWARATLDQLTAAAAADLAPFGDAAATLVAAARFIAARKN
ncbi:MAG: polyprenyl synthetase family protein [Hyphomicrobiaceae bacterium]|nr:polyprenyl synthetase family protein [Hyphomicrobiaceae bacterium]